MSSPIYLDYSATTPLDPEVRRTMDEVSSRFYGNPSSIHSIGRSARAVLDESRETVAKELHVATDEVVFTSGGTESDNAAILGVATWAGAEGRRHIVISAVEHHAVFHTAESLERSGFRVTRVPVSATGIVNPEDVRKAITADTCLVSVMTANNEVGTLQPVKHIGAIAHAAGALMHTDAVQSFGKLGTDVPSLGADLVSVTAHKIYGPKGIGALVVRKGVRLEPMLHGGGQEGGRRPGTENVSQAAGFAKAVTIMRDRREEESARLLILRDRLRRALRNAFGEMILFNGHPTETLPTIVNISFDSSKVAVDGDALIMGMDLNGVAVTSGSACTSGSLLPSHVLLAMGLPKATALATVRFSLGRYTTEEELDRAVDALREVVRKAGGAGVRS